MKFLYLLFLLLPLGNSADKAVEWVSPVEVDLGEIPLREPVFIEFAYRNISDEPLVIDNIRVSCGCTVPEWSEEPVLPDSVGAFQIEYYGKQTGYFGRPIKVYFSSQRKAEKLYIEGEVVDKP